jgi:hypothetical protein
MTQPGLIQKILTKCGLQDNATEHKTPSTMDILQRGEDNLPQENAWNHRMLVGMLTYLSASSRPDISYAKHQCDRFSVDPKRSHKLAIKRIVWYLKGTNTKGYVLSPSKDRNLDCFVDANFTGNWMKETSHDPASMKSRTG